MPAAASPSPAVGRLEWIEAVALAHSGGTAPESHRLPRYAVAGTKDRPFVSPAPGGHSEEFLNSSSGSRTPAARRVDSATVMGFLRQPQRSPVRRVLFQVHVWAGVALGFYVCLIGLTGAVLVFRPELQASAYPAFFRAPAGPGALAEADAVIDALRTSFPGDRFSGIDYPGARRGSFLTYMTHGGELRTVFSDARTGAVLGELPRDGWIQRVQELHFNLLLGTTGILVNGLAGVALVLLCGTGAVIWWPGLAQWTHGFVVAFGRGWRRVTWELHRATGIWAVLLLAMWAATGVYFSFPSPVRRAVDSVAPLTPYRPPMSSAPAPGVAPPAPSPAALVARARVLVPRGELARVMLPPGDLGAYAVVIATERHGDWDSSDEVTVYFDRFTGATIGQARAGERSTGDIVMTWMALLHMGNFGGLPIKAVWAAAALAFPLLGVTGFVMWWNRVVRRGLREGA